MWGEFQAVYAVTDYVDGVIAGVADFNGSPHVFVLEDEKVPSYRLRPIDGAAMLGETAPRDIWNPTSAIEALVRDAIRSSDVGFLVTGEFSPVHSSPSLKPDLRVRWERNERDGV